MTISGSSVFELAIQRVVQLEAKVAAWLRSAPATYGYLGILVVTSWSLQNISPHAADELLRAQSTNLDNLTDRPLQVLVASAFWTSGSTLPWELLLRFTLVMAPVERRLGTRRTVGVFAAGHVLATLLVVAGIDVGLRRHLVDLSLAHASDVGVSYGFFAVAGACTWLLVPSWWRIVWVTGLSAVVTAATVNGVTFTDVGHVISLAIGLATGPLVARWQRFPVPRAVLGGRPVVVPELLQQARTTVSALTARALRYRSARRTTPDRPPTEWTREEQLARPGGRDRPGAGAG